MTSENISNDCPQVTYQLLLSLELHLLLDQIYLWKPSKKKIWWRNLKGTATRVFYFGGLLIIINKQINTYFKLKSNISPVFNEYLKN